MWHSVIITQPDGTRSITEFTGQNAVNDFCNWVNLFSANGTSTSAQIEALNAASLDLETYSPLTNRRFAVLVTDEPMGETPTTRNALVERLDALTNTNGGGVFISVWENPYQLRPYYNDYCVHFTQQHPSLAINGGFDPVNWDGVSGLPLYPLVNLRNRILCGQ